MASQSRIESLIESIANILIGYFIAVIAQMVIFPMFDVHVSASEHLQIGLIFTVVSLVRSYCLRRLFNWITVNYRS